jgi:hypothetical protein
LITLVLVLSLALEIARHQLPRNRWRRAVRYLAPGLGVGLTATFTLSATRILIPSASVWVPLVIGCGVAAFVIGYLTPTPMADEDEYDYDDQAYEGRAQVGAGNVALSRVLDVRELPPVAPAPAPTLESAPWPPPRRGQLP